MLYGRRHRICDVASKQIRCATVHTHPMREVHGDSWILIETMRPKPDVSCLAAGRECVRPCAVQTLHIQPFDTHTHSYALPYTVPQATMSHRHWAD